MLERSGEDAPDGQEVDGRAGRWWLIPRNPVFNVYLHRFLDRCMGQIPNTNPPQGANCPAGVSRCRIVRIACLARKSSSRDAAPGSRGGSHAT